VELSTCYGLMTSRPHALWCNVHAPHTCYGLTRGALHHFPTAARRL
jgi:hypothetical protein